jgi:hypothetical protein
MNLRSISDQELLSKTRDLVAQEREVLIDILHHLREIERRRLYSDLKQASLFDYCINVLKYSNAQADRRIKAMRAIRELPQIEDGLASGKLSLTNVAKAQEFFRQEAKAGVVGTKEKLEVFKSLENKSTRDAEKILFAQSSLPAPEVKERIRQVSAQTVEVKFGADDEFLADMKALRGRLAHKKPNMNTFELLRAALKIALNETDPSKRRKVTAEKAVVRTPLPAPEVNLGRPEVKSERQYISVKAKQEIWQKSEGKCAICKSHFALENDHIQPVSLGGDNSQENLRLLCRNCNQREAIRKIGLETMTRYLT